MQDVEVFIRAREADAIFCLDGFKSPWDYTERQKENMKENEWGRLRITKDVTLRFIVLEEKYEEETERTRKGSQSLKKS